MKHRIVHTLALSIAALLLAAPLALADEGLSDNNALGLFLGICIVAASALVMNFTSRHYGRKRKANKRKNAARAKSKRRR